MKPYQKGFIFCESSQSLVGYGKWVIFHFGRPAPGFPFHVWGRSHLMKWNPSPIVEAQNSGYILNFSLPWQLHQSQMHLPGSLEGGQVPQESGVMETPSWPWQQLCQGHDACVAQCPAWPRRSLPEATVAQLCLRFCLCNFCYSCPFSLACKLSFPSLLGEPVKCLPSFD